jgi:hypothetical protein
VADINLTVSASLANLEAQLASVQGMTADTAKLIVKDLQSSIKAAEKASKDSAAATKRAMEQTAAASKKAADAAGDVGDKIGKFGSNAGKVAGVLDMVVPGLGGVARGAADIADGFEIAALGGTRLLAILGPVAAAVAVGAAAYQYLASELEAVNQKNEEAAKLASATLDRTRDITRLTRELADETALATGATTDEELAVRNRTEAIEAAYREQLQYLETQRASAAAANRGKGLNTAEAQTYRDLSAQVEALQAKQQDQISTAEGLIRARYAGQRADERAAAAAAAKADADRAAADAARAAEQAEREKERAQATYTRTVIDYAEAMRSLTADQRSSVSEEERILAAGQQRLRQLDELAQRTKYLALTNAEAEAAQTAAAEARVQIEQDVAEQIAAVREKARQDEAAKATEAREAEAAAALENAQLIAQGIGSVGQGLDALASSSADSLGRLQQQLADQSEMLTASEKAALQERVAAQRNAAIQAFEVAKAAKLAEAIINTAAAVTASLPNPIAAAVAGAAGAAQVATIAAQQPAFHSGGIVGAPPDEVNARLVRGEGVLSRSGVNAIGGEQAVRAANAGIPQTPQPMVIVQQYRHRVYNDFIRQNLRMGSPLAVEIRGTRTVGMREAL